MERSIPHVLDVFHSSPRARQRAFASREKTLKDTERKNGDNNSVVSFGHNEDESITKFFDYLDEIECSADSVSKQRRTTVSTRQTVLKETTNQDPIIKKENNIQESAGLKKEMQLIEHHLSMKKTIRKKMMRDLQHAFVEDLGELQDPPQTMTLQKKSSTTLNSLTFSKSRLVNCEQNFLQVLKDDTTKGKNRNYLNLKNYTVSSSKDDLYDNGTPSSKMTFSKGKPEILDNNNRDSPKDEKKNSFWSKLFSGKKTRR